MQLSFRTGSGCPVPGVHELDYGLENSIGAVCVTAVNPELTGAPDADQNGAVLMHNDRPPDAELSEAALQ